MRSVAALVRASILVDASYRLRMLLSLAGMVAAVVSVYFVANALDPVMADAIADEGGEYFGFVVVGMAAFAILGVAAGEMPRQVATSIRNGTFEALLGTSTPPGAVLIGLSGAGVVWTVARVALLVALGAVLGVGFDVGGMVAAVPILTLVFLAYLPVGLMATASVVAFRTAGPLVGGVVAVSALLGGVYYPTQVIPGWLEGVSHLIPLTYGLRPLRRLLLDGAGLADVWPDLAVLLAFAAVLTGVATLVLRAALRYALDQGTLSQY